MAANSVKFLYCTQAVYNAAKAAAGKLSATTFYRITDGTNAGDLYLGTKKVTNEADLQTLIDSLKDVATTGKAADVSIEDTAENFTGSTVEAALAELATMATTGSALVITRSTPEGVAARYTFTQGGNALDTAGANTVAEIDIPKDMVVSSGTVEDVTEAQIGTEGYPATGNAGKYIKLVVANGDTLWIAAADLVDIYTAEENASQIQLTVGANNVISAEIVDGSVDNDALGTKSVSKAKLDESLQGSIDKAESALQPGTDASKVEYKAAIAESYEGAGDGKAAITVKQAIKALEDALGESGSVATQIQNAIEDLDATVSKTAAENDGLALSVTEADGKLTAISGSLEWIEYSAD